MVNTPRKTLSFHVFCRPIVSAWGDRAIPADMHISEEIDLRIKSKPASSVYGDGQGASLRCALLSALLAALAAYHLLVIYGHGNADAMCEGLVSYTGADWALACGRWAIRYMADFSGNLVMPGIWLTLYALCCGLSAVLISRLWGIADKMMLCLVAALLTVNPTVIEQSLLQYMFMAWGLSNLLSILFVYLCCTRERGCSLYVLAPVCMMVAFGLYQSCVSLMCTAFCMTLIIRLFRGSTLKELWRLVLRFAAVSLLGTALYFLILRVETIRWAVEESERVELFSLKTLLTSLPTSFPQTYKNYAAYFFEGRLYRRQLYALLFAAGMLCAAAALAHLVKAGHPLEALGAGLLIVLIPAVTNLADIVFPYNEPVVIMQYQSMLLFPFLLALPFPPALKGRRVETPARGVLLILSGCILWGYLVSANATYRVYELSYRHMNFVTSSVMNDVYDLPDYSTDEVIAFAGFPDDRLLRAAVPAYKLAYGQYENFAFWDGLMGLQYGRRNYLLHYFGIDGGHIYGHLYNDAIASTAFREMPIWPEQGSVQRINGLIIVKLAQNPPHF